MYRKSFAIILICVIVSGKTLNNTAFRSSVFIFFDEGNKLQLNNELTVLKFWCSGSIIANKWTLTAASCFSIKKKYLSKPEPQRYVVVPTKGVTAFANSKYFKPYEVEKIIFHDQWKAAEKTGVNIALLLQKTAFHFTSYVGKSPMSIYPVKARSNCAGLTWMREPSGTSKSVIFKPQVLSGQITLKCSHKKHRSELCFNAAVNEGYCYDVQASILVCKNKIQGIASSKYGGADPVCADRRNPKQLKIIYENVGVYRVWINDRIAEDSFKYKTLKESEPGDIGRNKTKRVPGFIYLKGFVSLMLLHIIVFIK